MIHTPIVYVRLMTPISISKFHKSVIFCCFVKLNIRVDILKINVGTLQ